MGSNIHSTVWPQDGIRTEVYTWRNRTVSVAPEKITSFSRNRVKLIISAGDIDRAIGPDGRGSCLPVLNIKLPFLSPSLRIKGE